MEQPIKYFNGFVDDVRIYRQEDCIFSHATQRWFLNDHEEVIPEPVRTFELDRQLRAMYALKSLEKINWGVLVIPNKICTGIEELPSGYDKYIITKNFKAATRDLGFPVDKLVTPTNKVFNKYFKHIGYLNLLAY